MDESIIVLNKNIHNIIYVFFKLYDLNYAKVIRSDYLPHN